MSKKRNPNFSEMEIQTLLGEVDNHKDVLFSKVSNVITNSAKKRVWESICQKVNSSNTTTHQRTVDELKKKWTTYSSHAKKQASFNRREALKTGGGPPPLELTPLQDKVIGIIGETPIEGISGGTDTCSTAPTASTSTCENTPDLSFVCATGEADIDDDSEEAFSLLRKPEPPKTSRKKSDDETEVLIDIERERLAIEKQLLCVERERLDVERQRLEIERQRCNIEQQRHQLYMAQLGVQMSQFGIQVVENNENSKA